MVCEALENEDRQKAGELVRSRYPFDPPVDRRRSFSKFDRTRVFLRDGFLDRYSGDRLFFSGPLLYAANGRPAVE